MQPRVNGVAGRFVTGGELIEAVGGRRQVVQRVGARKVERRRVNAELGEFVTSGMHCAGGEGGRSFLARLRRAILGQNGGVFDFEQHHGFRMLPAGFGVHRIVCGETP